MRVFLYRTRVRPRRLARVQRVRRRRHAIYAAATGPVSMVQTRDDAHRRHRLLRRRRRDVHLEWKRLQRGLRQPRRPARLASGPTRSPRAEDVHPIDAPRVTVGGSFFQRQSIGADLHVRRDEVGGQHREPRAPRGSTFLSFGFNAAERRTSEPARVRRCPTSGLESTSRATTRSPSALRRFAQWCVLPSRATPQGALIANIVAGRRPRELSESVTARLHRKVSASSGTFTDLASQPVAQRVPQ